MSTDAKLTMEEMLELEKRLPGGLEYSDKILVRSKDEYNSGRIYTKFQDRTNQGRDSIHKKVGKPYRPLGVPLLDYRYYHSLSGNSEQKQQEQKQQQQKQQQEQLLQQAARQKAESDSIAPILDKNSSNPVHALLSLCSPRRMETQEESRAIRARVTASNRRILAVRAGVHLVDTNKVQEQMLTYAKTPPNMGKRSPRSFRFSPKSPGSDSSQMPFSPRATHLTSPSARSSSSPQSPRPQQQQQQQQHLLTSPSSRFSTSHKGSHQNQPTPLDPLTPLTPLTSQQRQLSPAAPSSHSSSNSTFTPSPRAKKMTVSKAEFEARRQAQVDRIRQINSSSPTSMWSSFTETTQSKATQSAASLPYFFPYKTTHPFPPGQILRQVSRVFKHEFDNSEDACGDDQDSAVADQRDGSGGTRGKKSSSSSSSSSSTSPTAGEEGAAAGGGGPHSKGGRTRKNPVETLARCYADFDLAKADLKERLFSSLSLMDTERSIVLKTKGQDFSPSFASADEDLQMMREQAEQARHGVTVKQHRSFAWLHQMVQYLERVREGTPTREEVQLMLRIGELMKERDALDIALGKEKSKDDLLVNLASFRKIVHGIDPELLNSKEVRQVLVNIQKLFGLSADEYNSSLLEVGYDTHTGKFRQQAVASPLNRARQSSNAAGAPGAASPAKALAFDLVGSSPETATSKAKAPVPDSDVEDGENGKDGKGDKQDRGGLAEKGEASPKAEDSGR